MRLAQLARFERLAEAERRGSELEQVLAPELELVLEQLELVQESELAQELELVLVLAPELVSELKLQEPEPASG